MLVCAMFAGDGCTDPVTGVIILTDDPNEGPEVVAHCDGHAPEIMHELIADGHNRHEMVTCTVNTGIVQYLPDDQILFGPRTMADNIGKRVEVATHLDMWMQGDRYGTIVSAHGITYTVQMDRSGDLKVLTESEVRIIPKLGLVK